VLFTSAGSINRWRQRYLDGGLPAVLGAPRRCPRAWWLALVLQWVTGQSPRAVLLCGHVGGATRYWNGRAGRGRMMPVRNPASRPKGPHHPVARTARGYPAPDQTALLTEDQPVTAGAVPPRLGMPLRQVFASRRATGSPPRIRPPARVAKKSS